MVMSAATLATELNNNMIIVDNESDAIDNLSMSWETYFYNASVEGIPVIGGSLASATSAMKTALIGMSVQNAAANAIQAGVIAFWGVVATSAASIWTTTPPCTCATPPTTLGTIAATLSGVFTSNKDGALDKAAATLAIANALHPLNIGGICIIPSPGTPTPIL